MKRLLFSLLFGAVLASAQATVSIANLTVNADAVTMLNGWLVTQLSGATATLTGSVAPGDTTINVVSTAGIAANSGFMLENEAVQITAKTATSFTVVRGIYGTTAAAHAIAANVRELLYPPTGPNFLNGALRHFIIERVSQLMVQQGSPAITTQNAAIAAANAAIATAQAAAVQ
jgi:hypothetical protein